MSWKEKMYEALAGYMRDSYGTDAVKVIDFEDRTEYGGYCETCAYETTVCEITYIDSKGKTQKYTYWGPFSELIGGLS